MPLTAAQRRQRRAQKRHKTLTCCRCGKPFTAVRKTALYCSPICRQPPLGGRTQAGLPTRQVRRADKRVRNYLRRQLPLPNTLAELVRAIGLTSTDAKLLGETYGRYYFVMRIAQAWPKPLPFGQTSPAVFSTWNNQSKAMKYSLNLKVK